MRRTGHDFQDIYVFREFPDGVREQHGQGGYHLRAVGAKAQASNPDRDSPVTGKPVNPYPMRTTGQRDRKYR